MSKIAIDAGHGLYTAGKRCLKKLDPNETREWTLNSRIANKVVTLLKQRGHEVMRLDDITGKTDVPLNTRTKIANSWGADYLVSIHHNAGISGGYGGGIIVVRYLNPSEMTLKLQKALYNAVIEKTALKGNRSVPMPKQDLRILRESKMPAVLIECGFMDSATDIKRILTEDFATKCAEGIANGICELAGVTNKNEEVRKTKVLCNGEEKTINAVLKDGENFIRLRDLDVVLGLATVSYNSEKKMPIITK